MYVILYSQNMYNNGSRRQIYGLIFCQTITEPPFTRHFTPFSGGVQADNSVVNTYVVRQHDISAKPSLLPPPAKQLDYNFALVSLVVVACVYTL